MVEFVEPGAVPDSEPQPPWWRPLTAVSSGVALAGTLATSAMTPGQVDLVALPPPLTAAVSLAVATRQAAADEALGRLRARITHPYGTRPGPRTPSPRTPSPRT